MQLFVLGEKSGKTVAGQNSMDITIELIRPYSIALDANKYLFISDSGNHRIVASGPNGFRCLVGCDGNGKQAHQLNMPTKFSFDVHGNMFVYDSDNDRVQKFHLQKDSCSEYCS